MRQRNNQLATCVGALIGFVCALFVRWFTITDSRLLGDGRSLGFEINGIHGNITLLFDTPIWLLLVASTFLTVLQATNILGWTSIPWWIIAGGSLLALLNYAAPLCVLDDHTHLGIGPAVAMIATLTVLGLISTDVTVRQPRPALGRAATNLWH